MFPGACPFVVKCAVMFRPLEIFIGLRYTRAKRRNHFISFIALFSMLGIGLGVLVMITVLSVMNGFQKEVRERLLSTASHATVAAPNGSLRDWRPAAFLQAPYHRGYGSFRRLVPTASRSRLGRRPEFPYRL